MRETKTVLIVEDDPTTHDLLERRLERYGLSLSSASDVAEAMRCLRDLRQVDALVLDIMLPYGAARDTLGEGDSPQIDSGIRLLEWLRAQEGGAALWVSVVTARAHPEAIQRIEALLGAAGRLYRKPFDTHRFEHEMATALGLPSQVPEGLRPLEDEGDLE